MSARRAARSALEETGRLFRAECSTSDAWLLASVRLNAACRLFAAATYCRYEWQEPDDAYADRDSHGAVPGPLAENPEELARLRVLRVERRTLPSEE